MKDPPRLRDVVPAERLRHGGVVRAEVAEAAAVEAVSESVESIRHCRNFALIFHSTCTLISSTKCLIDGVLGVLKSIDTQSHSVLIYGSFLPKMMQSFDFVET